ncbi:MAG: uncharacterized protein QOE90_1279 [Thermoplasmata archaeon]|jgi:predicted MPP superfamily phosphohydrolase|nr:uncharacterized protein [Thermoplasmata archaeon]
MAAGATVTEGETQTAPPRASFLIRVAAFFVGWSLLHFGVAAALLWGVTPGRGWTLAAAYVLLVLVPLVAVLRTFREHAYPSAATRVWVMRPFWYVQLALPFVSSAGVLGLLAGWPFGHALAWGRWAVVGMVALVIVLDVAGYVGSRALVTKRIEIAFPDLPEGLDGLTIAQLSDLHVGPHTPAAHLRSVVRRVEEAKPDLIAFTGDQVDDYDQDVARFAQVFGPLRAPLGVFAIAGNHDVYAGWPGVRDGMAGVGMRVLVNAAEPVQRGGSELWVVGTGDPAGLRSFDGPQPDVAPDISKALAGVPEGAFTLCLAHNPALWPALAQRGVRVTLSGHTHHGQLSIPLLNWCLASPFLEHAMGRHQRGASVLYINAGTNFWGIPFRLGAWPEVTIVTLRRGIVS